MESGTNTSRFHQKVFLRIYVTPSVTMVSVLKCYCIICEFLPNHFWLQRLYISVQVSCSVMPDSLWPHGLQHTRLPCPSPTPGTCSNSYPSSQWCHLTISSSVIPFSSCLQSFPALRSFPVNQFFASGSQSIGSSASASVLPMNIHDWLPLGLTGWISLQCKGLSRIIYLDIGYHKAKRMYH